MKLLRWLLIFAFASPLAAQNVRWDLPVTTVLAQGGNLLPIYAVPGAPVAFYSCTGATPPVCATLATTYISGASATSCPTSAQIVLNGSSTCVSNADPDGNMGAWFQPGQYMAAITAQGAVNDYYFTVATGGPSLPVNNPAFTGTLTGPSVVASVNGAINVMAPPYSAKCDGTTDDSAAFAAAVAAVGAGVLVIPSGVTCKGTITLNAYTKLIGYGATLIPSGNSENVLTIPTGEPLQSTDKQVIEGLTIDGGTTTGTTCLLVENNAQIIMRDVTVTGCSAVGLNLQGAQFGEYYALHAYNNLVGVKIVSISGSGGGNSNDFYGLQAVGNTVGVFLNDASGAYGQGMNIFYDSSILSNSVVGFAAYSPTAFGNTDTWYGGSPESNAPNTSPTSVTVDGIVIPRSSVYLYNTELLLDGVSVSDAQANPWAILSTGSNLRMQNLNGYGQPFGVLAQTDATSSVSMVGTQATIGQIQGVNTWPQDFEPSSQGAMSGNPVATLNPNLANAYTGNPVAPAVGAYGGATGTGTYTDPIYGVVNTVIHTTAAGGWDTNAASIASPSVPVPSATVDAFASVLIRASVNCTYAVGFYHTTAEMEVPLVAGQWQRVVLVYRGVTSGTSLGLSGFPVDTSGPTVAFAMLQTASAPTLSYAFSQMVAAALHSGAVGSTIPYSSLAAGVTRTICTATFSIPATAIPSANKAEFTQPCTNAVVGDNIACDFNGGTDPTTLTGFLPSTSGTLTPFKWVTGGTANFALTNNTGASITPTPFTVNCRDVR